jgi:hypothetical protein
MGVRAIPVSGVQPELLKWARDSVNMTTAEVAQKLGKLPQDIEAWVPVGAEGGGIRLSVMAQDRNLLGGGGVPDAGGPIN